MDLSPQQSEQLAGCTTLRVDPPTAVGTLFPLTPNEQGVHLPARRLYSQRQGALSSACNAYIRRQQSYRESPIQQE